ncbi:bile acid:sodium symporter family protein [Bartonella tamiae]|uniref:Bile acid transporter n=1 Tax=Bartonella tamiae Th239 TaxID=1094558 RepID=J0R0X4_9HYPH|nr:bile acid:sodium symporter family protein [Bartonella tamiae]EJF89189.1 bile acid transporter [Bartonella tamiae Th239]EJF95408.1 bile acid transporter [Bartonella tamiae Th307]
MQIIVQTLTRFFPLWVILFAGFAFFQSEIVLSFHLGSYVSWLLGLIMLGMGLTMSPKDFKMVLTRPAIIGFGVLMRCLLMPFIAFGLAHLLKLPDALAVGLILVGCCPSGTASNVMTFIARGDIALSVTLTSVITLLSPILTPISFYVLAGSYIHVDVWIMMFNILTVVILPVAIGVFLHSVMRKFVAYIQSIVPLISIVAIILIIMAVVAANANNLANMAIIAFVSVVLHNGIGLASGYGLSRLFGLSQKHSRAVSFEIGMENSGLAIVLVSAVTLNPIAAIPAAIFSVWHNLSGSLLAGYWANRPIKD